MAASSHPVTALRVPKRIPLATALLRWLRDSIADGSLRPGDRLPTESELVERFGVSRAVVRETIARLSADGQVEARQGSGVFVLQPSADRAFQLRAAESTFDDAKGLLELRLAVETEMAGLAAERRGDADVARLLQSIDADAVAGPAHGLPGSAETRFRMAIAAAAGNAYFTRFLAFLEECAPASDVDTASDPEIRAAELAERRMIVAAIAAGDSRQARMAARLHLMRSLERSRACSPGGPSTGEEA